MSGATAKALSDHSRELARGSTCRMPSSPSMFPRNTQEKTLNAQLVASGSE